MAISMEAVKALREKTSAGILDCRKALDECNGNLEEAVDWLRKKGLSAAAKKADRVAADGVVAVALDDRHGAVIEINAETDFVARSDAFQELAAAIVQEALAGGADVERILNASIDLKGQSAAVQEQIQQVIATVGENVTLRRAAELRVENGLVASYVHNALSPNMGSIGVLIGIESASDNTDKLQAFARQVAMHVAASKPLAVDESGLDATVLDREREIAAAQAKEMGRPDNVLDKIIEGRVRKFVANSCLLSQPFVHDSEKTVAQAIEQFAGDLGAEVRVTGFVCFALGEGIERGQDDFAAEVASMAGG